MSFQFVGQIILTIASWLTKLNVGGFAFWLVFFENVARAKLFSGFEPMFRLVWLMAH